MKKIIFFPFSFLFLLFIIIFGFLSVIGYETDKFNTLLENKITSNIPNTNINLNKIKIKIDIKNLSFFMTTSKPIIKYYTNELSLNKIDAYINLKSLFVGKPKIKKVNIDSEEIGIKKIKEIVKYQKPSNLKKFFLNEVEEGKLTFKLDLNLKNNKIVNYEINGIAKSLFASAQKIHFKNMSFIYSIKQNSGEIGSIRGNVNGLLINSGNIKFDNSKTLNINGNLKSDLNLNKEAINKLLKIKLLQSFETIQTTGKIGSTFDVSFDKTLKVLNYQFEASGDIQKLEAKFSKPLKYPFLKDKINILSFKNTDFQVNLHKDKKKIININGEYKFDNSSFQKFDLKNLYDLNVQKYSIKGDFNNDITFPILNYSTENKVFNINSELEIIKNKMNLKKFFFQEGKNKIEINNLVLKNKKLFKFENISIKTYNNNKQFNNNFKINFGNNIKISGSKYDATNLIKLLEQNNDSNYFKNIKKEISINLDEVSTSVSDTIYNFNLLGYIDNGRFNKIVSKGEFEDGKYLDISLRVDKNSKKKILEVYSDLPKQLLSNYKFFDGLSGGQLLLFSSYDLNNSNTNLTIENFKVKDAPGLVKLLSLADFGGMVDALSGEGLSFEKLEMNMNKNDQVLNLKELYAIGPSISILMDGYVETKTGLVSLRGTMVPAKTLNKFLSKLPIVGDILIPKEIGEGLFGISFKMKGTPGKIKTTVNPIKTLTPRFIQKALKKSN